MIIENSKLIKERKIKINKKKITRMIKKKVKRKREK